MSYIDLINQFWRLNEEYCFTPNETKLYFALLNMSNRFSWKQSFNQSNEYLAAQCGITVPTLVRARNILQQKGLIKFKSGDGRRNNTEYQIMMYTEKGLNNFTLSDTLCDTLSDTLSDTLCDTLCDENALHNIRLRQRLDKDNKKENIKEKSNFSLDFIKNDELKEVFVLWLNYKKSIRNGYKTQASVEEAYNKLTDLGNNDPDICKQIVKQSIANNYKGMFALSDTNKHQKQNGQQKYTNTALGSVATSERHKQTSL